MSLPVSVTEKKKAELSENNLAIHPELSQRFPVAKVKDIIRSTFQEYLGGINSKSSLGSSNNNNSSSTNGTNNPDGSSSTNNGSKYTTENSKLIADSIKKQLKNLNLPRYKYIVQIFIGENKGQGIQIGTRCLWDKESDDYATESFQNENIFAIGIAYGAYAY